MGKFREMMEERMEIRGFSPATRKAYVQSMRDFVRYHRRPPDQLTQEDIARYQLHLTRERRVAWATFNVRVCALRFFYGEVLGRPWPIEHIRHQKTGRKLPEVLSAEEIAAIARACANAKYRTMILTIYGAGLRLSEVLQLQVGDIDSRRMTIRVRQGKGKKDRDVMLAAGLLGLLRDYWRRYRPPAYLFPSRTPDRPIHPTAFQRAFRAARVAAGVTKQVSVHSLRHAFATHLMESGANLLVIQRLLGHTSLQTTQVYTHLASSYLAEVRNPLDTLLTTHLADIRPS